MINFINILMCLFISFLKLNNRKWVSLFSYKKLIMNLKWYEKIKMKCMISWLSYGTRPESWWMLSTYVKPGSIRSPAGMTNSFDMLRIHYDFHLFQFQHISVALDQSSSGSFSMYNKSEKRSLYFFSCMYNTREKR